VLFESGPKAYQDGYLVAKVRTYKAVKLVEYIRNCYNFIAPVDIKTADVHYVWVQLDVLDYTRVILPSRSEFTYDLTCIENFPCLIHTRAVADILSRLF
jgi:hypothetical protein